MGSRTSKTVKPKIKEDAGDLAQLVYDMYKEDKRNGKIVSGQNNAQPKSD